jgi:hypothetical protein
MIVGGTPRFYEVHDGSRSFRFFEPVDTATASAPEEIRELGKAGWTKYDELGALHFYGKPKRFSGLNSVGLQ